MNARHVYSGQNCLLETERANMNKSSIGQSIILHEDEPIARRNLEAAVMGLGYLVHLAQQREGILAYLKATRADVAVVVLGVVTLHSGLDLLRGIRRHHPELPVIMLTSVPTVVEAVAAMKIGATDVLCRPFGAKRAGNCHQKRTGGVSPAVPFRPRSNPGGNYYAARNPKCKGRPRNGPQDRSFRGVGPDSGANWYGKRSTRARYSRAFATFAQTVPETQLCGFALRIGGERVIRF